MDQPDPQQPDFSEMPTESFPSPRATRARRTQLPWMWLAVGFVVILALGGVVYLIGGGGAAQPVIIAEPTVTPTSAGQPTATPRQLPTSTPVAKAATAQPDSSSGSVADIAPGIEVEVTGTGINGLSLRAGPGTNYARLRTASDGEVLSVVDGPQEADGYEWWLVRDDQGNEGWGVGEWLRPTAE